MTKLHTITTKLYVIGDESLAFTWPAKHIFSGVPRDEIVTVVHEIERHAPAADPARIETIADLDAEAK